ncbi:MAG: chromate transporter [Vicinamibacterales bacterium]
MAEQQLQGLIATLDEYLVKKAPFQIPEGGKEFIVRFGPWISLVLLLLTLPLLLVALGLGAMVAPFAGVSYGAGFGVVAILALVQIVMFAMALPGLFARKMSGWTMLFYAELVGFLSSIVSGSIISGIIGTLIGLYILFQVRTKYAS